jgi:hypothetical protein
MGLSERYTWVAANMMTVTLPESAYDLVILAHVCRFIGERATRDLFAKLHGTLRPGGVIVVADTFLNEDQSGPAFAITLDLSMLVNTANGRALSTRECMTWLYDSGYHHARCLDVAGPAPVLVARKGEST